MIAVTANGSERCDHGLPAVFETQELLRHTAKNTINRLKHFVVWLPVPLEQTGYEQIKRYIEMLMNKRRSPVTIKATWRASAAFLIICTMKGSFASSTP